MPLISTRPELTGAFGMAASTHWLASQTAMSVLERGGNAVDAAVSAGFVLQVVEPHLNGPGGDLPALVHSPDDDAVTVVCGQGTAPTAASIEAFAGLGLDEIPGTGPLPACVPGAFGAWCAMLQRWGTWRLADVLEPAIGWARTGAPVLPRVSATLAQVERLFTTEWTTSAQTYLADAVPAPWDRLRLEALADTYERVLAEAAARGPGREQQIDGALDAWYRGFVAEQIDRFCRGRSWLDSSGGRHNGMLTGDDLAGWVPTFEEPVIGRYGEFGVAKTGPWGQGPVLLQSLALLDDMDLGNLLDEDPDWLHLVLEASKLAFADREAWCGDPTHVDVPITTLLSGEYTRSRRALIDSDHAHRELRPGTPDGRSPQLAPLHEGARGSGVDLSALSASLGEPTVPGDLTRGDTCHLDVVDRWGTMVSATPSGGWLQSSPVVPGLGFPLGTRAQMFWLTPGLPSSLRPGARPRTTLSPSLALREDRPWMAFGTPGGDQQDQWSLVFFLRAAHAARHGPGAPGLQALLDAPMAHHEHAPSSFAPRRLHPGRVVLEERWPASVHRELARRGHDLDVVDGWSLGRLSVVAREADWLRAGSDARSAQGYAVGR